MPTFEDISAQQGWDTDSQLAVALAYIANQQDDAAFVEFAANVARLENESPDGSVIDWSG